LKAREGDNVSAPSSFIANAHNELYAFYTTKGDLMKKNSNSDKSGGGAAALTVRPP